MRPYLILQARTGSTRLPGKMTLPFYEGRGVLEILLSRLRDASGFLGVEGIMVATTLNPSDDAIAEIARASGVEVYRGSEADVLSRFIGAAETVGADRIIRVCADNVFLDIESLRFLVESLKNRVADYVSFRTSEGRPSILTHFGFFAEGVRTEALRRVAEMTDAPLYHEHVTNFIYTHPEEFRIELYPVEDRAPGLEGYPDLRLTMDTAEDFELQKDIYGALSERGVPVTPRHIIDYLEREHPEYFEVMRRVIARNGK